MKNSVRMSKSIRLKKGMPMKSTGMKNIQMKIIPIKSI